MAITRSTPAATPRERVATLSGRYPGELIVTLLRDPLQLLDRMAALGADAAHARLGRRDLYLLCTPSLARALLSHAGEGLRKERALRLARVVLGTGLLTSEGEPHRRDRRRIAPVFDERHVNRYTDIAGAAAAAFAEGGSDGQVVDVRRAMAWLMLDISARSFLGAAPGASTDRLLAALDDATQAFNRYRNPFAELFDRIPVPGTLRLRRARATIDEVIAEIAGRAEAESPLHRLLSGFEDSARARDHLVTMLLAASETTAVALTWTLALLSREPDEMARLKVEANAVLGRAAPGARHLPGLGMTRRALAESMRLYPPVWAVSRETTAPLRLGELVLPAGVTVMVSQYVLHRDPLRWPDPQRFDPDRFADRSAIEPFSYLPFSAGPRGCIGERLAWAEATLVLATLLREWRLEPCEPPVRRFSAGVSLRPDRPIRLRLSRWGVA